MGSVVPGSRVPGGTHENPPYLGSIGFRVPSRTIKSGFQWVPGSRQIGPKWVPVGSGFQAKWVKVGSGGFRVPGRNPKSGFQWVPGSGSEPKKWVPDGYPVPGKFLLMPTPESEPKKWVPGSESEPKKWVPGSELETKKWVSVGSGFRPKFFLCRPLFIWLFFFHQNNQFIIKNYEYREIILIFTEAIRKLSFPYEN